MIGATDNSEIDLENYKPRDARTRSDRRLRRYTRPIALLTPRQGSPLYRSSNPLDGVSITITRLIRKNDIKSIIENYIFLPVLFFFIFSSNPIILLPLCMERVPKSYAETTIFKSPFPPPPPPALHFYKAGQFYLPILSSVIQKNHNITKLRVNFIIKTNSSNNLSEVKNLQANSSQLT